MKKLFWAYDPVVSCPHISEKWAQDLRKTLVETLQLDTCMHTYIHVDLCMETYFHSYYAYHLRTGILTKSFGYKTRY